MDEPTKARTVRSAAESMGFTVISGGCTLTKDEVLWAKSENGHVAGTLRTPASSIEGVWQVGYRTEARLAFQVFWSPKFEHAHVYDPVGRFRELKADYSYTAAQAKDYGYSVDHADKLTRIREDAYNDGTQIMQYDWEIKGANEFYAWIDEWLITLKSDHKRLTPKPRAPKPTKEEVAQEREVSLLSGGDWSG